MKGKHSISLRTNKIAQGSIMNIPCYAYTSKSYSNTDIRFYNYLVFADRNVFKISCEKKEL